MQLIDRESAQEILSEPDLRTFWGELGQPIELPEHLHYLYEPDVGVFVLEPVEDYYGIHVAIFQGCRGRRAVKAGKEAIAWVLSRSCKALARIRKNQPETRFYASLCGMKRYSESETHVFYEAMTCQ